MARCRDCIHFDVCEARIAADKNYPEKNYTENNNCSNYKDRSKLISTGINKNVRKMIQDKLKNAIIKLNDSLFWGSKNSTLEYKYSDILEIKETLIDAYNYVSEKN